MENKQNVILMVMDTKEDCLSIDLSKFKHTKEQLLETIKKKVIASYTYECKKEENDEKEALIFSKQLYGFYNYMAKRLNTSYLGVIGLLNTMSEIDKVNTYRFIVRMCALWMYDDKLFIPKESDNYYWINLLTGCTHDTEIGTVAIKNNLSTLFKTTNDALLAKKLCAEYSVYNK